MSDPIATPPNGEQPAPPPEPDSVRAAYDPHRTPACEPTAEEHRQVLAAVLEAIDMPFGATVGDEERRNELVSRRAIQTVVHLQALLEESDPRDRAVTLAHLRDRISDYPVNYRTLGGES